MLSAVAGCEDVAKLLTTIPRDHLTCLAGSPLVAVLALDASSAYEGFWRALLPAAAGEPAVAILCRRCIASSLTQQGQYIQAEKEYRLVKCCLA